MTIKVTRTCDRCGMVEDCGKALPSPQGGGWRKLEYGSQERMICNRCCQAVIKEIDKVFVDLIGAEDPT